MTRLSLVAALLLSTPVLATESFVPESPDTVLLHVAPSEDARVETLRALRSKLQEQPNNAQAAARFAQSAIRYARRSHDARWYGYAEGAIAPWQGKQDVPADIRVIRATLAQHDHRFAAALQDLDKVLQQQPQHLQARLTRAVIHTVQARYAPALADCDVVREFQPLLGTACAATPASLSGDAERALRSLQAGLALGRGDAEARRWALAARAQIGWRLAKPKTAQWFAQAMDSDGAEHDRTLQLSYVDFLLDEGEARKALAIARPLEDSNEGLVASIRARMRLGEDDASVTKDRRRLVARLEAERARGSARHFGTEARAALYVLQEPGRAVWLARRNWSTQKTPRDALLLARAALQSEQPEAAHPIREWMQRNGVQDRRLDRILKAMKTPEAGS